MKLVHNNETIYIFYHSTFVMHISCSLCLLKTEDMSQLCLEKMVCDLGASPSFRGVTLFTKDEVLGLGVLLDPVLSMASELMSVVSSAYFHL